MGIVPLFIFYKAWTLETIRAWFDRLYQFYQVPNIEQKVCCGCPGFHFGPLLLDFMSRLINEDKGRQDVLLDLALQFEDSCAVRDDLRKTYEKCNDISQESRTLICTLLKESSEKDRKLHLSIYGKKEFHQLRMDEEALKEMLEEEAMNKKAQGEKIRQEQAENDAFFLEFGVVSWLLFGECSTGRRLPVPRCNTRAYRATHHRGDWHGSFLEEVAFLRENPAIRRSGALCLWCLHEECQLLLPVMASGKNGDDGDLLLFQDSPGTCDISAGALGMECPVVAFCSGELSGYTDIVDSSIGIFTTVATKSLCVVKKRVINKVSRSVYGKIYDFKLAHNLLNHAIYILRTIQALVQRPAVNPLLRQWELPTVPYLDTNGVVPLVICLRGLDVNHRAWIARLYQLPGPNSEQSPDVARPGSLGHALDSCRGHNEKFLQHFTLKPSAR
ncbi:hypothetical protein Tco_0761435 [Tanacetum coccineum]